MKLVILTGEDLEHRFVAARLAEAFPAELQAIVVARPRPRRAYERMLAYWRRYTARQLLSRMAARMYWSLRRYEARRVATLTRCLFANGGSDVMPRPDLLRFVPGHNSAECLAILRELQPDVIAVYGTAMIRQPVMDLASKVILNLHTGLSPWYRGSDTIFWPLHNEEPEMIGATLHVLEAEVDAGKVIATGRPRIDPDDDENTLFCKAVVLGTQLYIDAIRAAGAGTLRAETQRLGLGREYRFVQRTVSAERRVQRLIAGGLLRRAALQGAPAVEPGARRTTQLHIMHVYAPTLGGIERVVESLAVGMRRAGHRVCVAAFKLADSEDSSAVQRMRAAGVEIHPVTFTPRGYRRERRDFARLLERVRPDIVHTHGVRTDVIDGTVVRRLGFPIVTTLHGRTGGGLKWRFFEWVQYGVIQTFDAVVAVSQPQVDYLLERGVPQNRIHLILNGWAAGTKPMSRDAARGALEATPDVPLVGWVGRLGREKGADVLVDALVHLADVALEVAVIGDGAEALSLHTQARALGVDHRIHWHGALPDAGRLFPAFDLFVLSSRTEGTPIALFEAMAARVPVVATRVGGVPSVVSPEEAVLVPPENPRALADAIRRVLGSPGHARERANRAYERLSSDFDAEAWIDRYISLYGKVRAARTATLTPR